MDMDAYLISGSSNYRNLLFPWFSCEQQIPHPQTTRVRDDKSDFFRSLLGKQRNHGIRDP